MKIRNLLIYVGMLLPIVASALTQKNLGIHDPQTGFYYIPQGDGKNIAITGYDPTGASTPALVSGKLTIPMNLNYVTDNGSSSLGVIQSITCGAYNPVAGFTNGIAGNTTITSIDVSSAIINIIDYSAFANCTSLSTITGAGAVNTINAYAFYGCSALSPATVLTAFWGVKTIGTDAFAGCGTISGSLDLSTSTSLSNVGPYTFFDLPVSKYPPNLLIVGEGAFLGCTTATSALNLSKTHSIGDYAFGYNASAGTSLTLPTTTSVALDSLGQYSFYNAGVQASVATLPSTLTYIKKGAFYGCSGLTSTLNLTNIKYDNASFAKCTGLTGTMTLPPTTLLSYIPDRAFDNCGFSYTNLQLPAAITNIGQGAFYNNSNLSGDINTAATSIGSWAFAYDGGTSTTSLSTGTYSGLRSAVLTAASPALGDSIFQGCANLEYIDASASAVTTSPSPENINHTSLSRIDVSGSSTFYGAPAHTLVYLNSADASKLPAVSTTDGENYIEGGNCHLLYIQDGTDYYLPYGFTTQQTVPTTTYGNDIYGGLGTGAETTPLTTYRSFPSGTGAGIHYATLYLPYNAVLNSTNLTAYSLSDRNLHDPASPSGTSFLFKQMISGSVLSANTPYIIAGTDGSDKINGFGSVNSTYDPVPATPISRVVYDASGNASYSTIPISGVTAVDNGAAPSIPSKDPILKGIWNYYGTTEYIPNSLATLAFSASTTWKSSATMWGTAGITSPVTNTWILDNGTIWQKPVSTLVLSPMHGFLYGGIGTGGVAAAAPNIMLENLDGTVTSINNITEGNQPSNSVETRIYNIGGEYMGKDLNALPKGLYIVNGKKVVKN